MAASETSKSVAVYVSTQSAHGTADTTLLQQQLLTEWAATPTVSFDEIDDEMDGNIVPTAVPVRLGISTPVRAAGRLRSANIIPLIKAAGFGVTTTTSSPVASANTHVLVPVATDALFPWSTFLAHMGGASILKRIISDVRLSGLTLSGEKNAVARFEANGIGGHEQVASGSETTTSEASPVLRTVEGSFTVTNDAGGTIAATARSFSAVVTNEFSSGDDNFVIGDHEFDWQTWLSMTVTGQVDTVFNKTAWEAIFYAGESTAGSDYSFTSVTGGLDLTVKSATMVTGTTPYSMRIEIPHLTVMQPDDVRASGRSELRMVLPFRAYQSGADPLIRITFVNNIASYA